MQKCVLFLIPHVLASSRHRQGLTLESLAQVLIDRGGAQFAINLDGGSSTTLAVNGTVMNRPTCLDLPFPTCERAVSSIVCLGRTPSDVPRIELV
jgi:exopolysaccharide biosynthesis protein